MTPYKRTQIEYLMLVVTLAVLVLFVWVYATASAEPASVDSGPNFAITAIMALILFTLASFATRTVSIDTDYLRIKFGCGMFTRKLALKEIASVVSSSGAVEITMKNGRAYRVGTNEPEKLESAIKVAVLAGRV